MEFVQDVLPLACIVCIGIFIQSAAGFAAGLLIVPAMLYCGYTVPEAQSSLLVATIPQNLWGVWSFREHLEPRTLVGPGIGRLALLPIGVATLYQLESLSILTVRQIVGAIVLVVTLAIIWFHPQPRERLHPAWSWLAFPLSGFLQGLVGMGGPAMVFWVQAHDWDTRKMRAFLFAMYTISLVPAMIILYSVFGNRVIRPGLITLALMPLLLAMTCWGLKVGTEMGARRLRRITIMLLIGISAAGIFAR